MTKRSVFYFCCCLTVAVLISCRTGRDAIPVKLDYTPVAAAYADSGITFVSFNFVSDNDGIEIAHAGTIQTRGTLKRPEEWPRSDLSRYLLRLYSPEKTPLLDIFIADPLRGNREVFSEDGHIEGKEVVYDNRIMSFRFPKLKEDFTAAALYRIEAGSFKLMDTATCY
jgi:hypothetical protein